MTTKEQLHELVDQFDEAAAERLLSAARSIAPSTREVSSELPAFVGAFASDHSDTSARTEQILRDELGSPR